MRLRALDPRSLPAALLALLLLETADLAPRAAAFPFPRDEALGFFGLGFLQPRQCVQMCGEGDKYCCVAGQACYTTGTIAGCKNTLAGGGFALYTTTWTETHTHTSTISSYFPAATTPAPGNCIPEAGTGQIACGSICCANWQYCAYAGQCLPNVGAGGGGGGGGGGAPPPMTTYQTTFTSGGQVVTTQFIAPYRVTGTDGATPTNTDTAVGATTTGAAIGSTTGGGGGLSPGAIAGIVIGTLVGVTILLFICACCLIRGLWNGLLGLLGIGKKKEKKHERESTIIEEERYSRHGSAAHRERHSGWFGFGGRPSSATSRRHDEKKKKKDSGMGWLGLAGAAGTLLLLLGLRRGNKKSGKSRSEVSSTFYSDSYTSSGPSSRSRSSRGARTHRSGGTHRSRAHTHMSRGPPSRGPPSRAASRRPPS